jgi:hypothetical protein
MPAIVIIMIALPEGVVLDNRGHHPGRLLVEVYDDLQPTPRLDVTAIEALATSDRVQRAQVGARNRAHDDVDVVEQPGTAAGQMQMRAGVEHHRAPIRVGRLRMVGRHLLTLWRTADTRGTNAVFSRAVSACAPLVRSWRGTDRRR